MGGLGHKQNRLICRQPFLNLDIYNGASILDRWKVSGGEELSSCGPKVPNFHHYERPLCRHKHTNPGWRYENFFRHHRHPYSNSLD